MKKIIAAFVLLCVFAVGVFGQTGLDIREYSRLFLNPAGTISRTYTSVVSNEDELRLGALDGNLERIDTPLEIALLSSAAGVVDVRPVQANEILGNAKQADLKFGFWVLQEIKILHFLGNTMKEGLHRVELKIITDRRNVTEAEVEAYYRNNIRGLVSQIVDEEFNKVSFLLETGGTVAYNAVLTRNPQTGQYVLSYGGVETNGETRTVTGNSVDALSSAMRDGTNRADFTQLSRDQIRAQAALIPAVSNVGKRSKEPRILLAEILTGLLTENTPAGRELYYRALLGLYARFGILLRGDIAAQHAVNALIGSIRSLSNDLGGKFDQDIRVIRLNTARSDTSDNIDDLAALVMFR